MLSIPPPPTPPRPAIPLSATSSPITNHGFSSRYNASLPTSLSLRVALIHKLLRYGPIFVGVVLNILLYGIMITQTYLYFNVYKKYALSSL